MEQLIKNVEKEFENLSQNPTHEDIMAFKKAINEVNENIKPKYFNEKKSNTIEVINYHLNTLKKHGSLILRNQSTTSDYYLGKV